MASASSRMASARRGCHRRPARCLTDRRPSLLMRPKAARGGWIMQRAWSAGLLVAMAGCTLDGLPYPVRNPSAVTDGGVPATDGGAAMDGGTDTGVTICAPGETNCGRGCVNTGTDFANCGSCGHACAAGQTCSSGTCSTATCPSGMAVIPAGTFVMGAADLSSYRATPVHTVTLTSYCMDVTEVTVAAYATCPSETCTAPATSTNGNWMAAGRDNHPINCVTWDQSRAYCQWVHGGGGDLPTEAQWTGHTPGVMTRRRTSCVGAAVARALARRPVL